MALKRSLVEVEQKIKELRQQIKKEREAKRNSPAITSVRYEQTDQDKIYADLSQYLHRFRVINMELTSFQQRLKKYEAKHLRSFLEQEKLSRTALLEAQEYLQQVFDQSLISFAEIKLLEPAKTNQPGKEAIWILTLLSFLAALALWLILLLRIRYFR